MTEDIFAQADTGAKSLVRLKQQLRRGSYGCSLRILRLPEKIGPAGVSQPGLILSFIRVYPCQSVAKNAFICLVVPADLAPPARCLFLSGVL